MTFARSIRRAEANDVPRMAEILIESGLCQPIGLEDRVRCCLERSSDLCFVSTEGGLVTGLVLAAFNGFHVFLSHLAVDPSRQHTGVGAALHDHLVARGEELKALGIVTDSWLISTGFYYQLGYRLPGAVFLIRDVIPTSRT